MLYSISNSIVIAAAASAVPDNGITGLMLSGALISIVAFARYLKTRGR